MDGRARASAPRLGLLLGFLSLAAGACGDRGPGEREATPAPPAANADEAAIRYLESRVRQDTGNFVAYDKLAGYYLQRMRENGSLTYLDLAERAAHASLAALPAEGNPGGLAMLAQVELAMHDFTGARDHGARLTELEPGTSYPYQILGDALLELGDYGRAAAAYRRMERLVGRRGESRLNLETRLGRLAFLHGQTDAAERHLSAALASALDRDSTPRETIACCHWQLGELYFALGHYAAAETHYREALVTFPDYFRALGALARVRAAQGDVRGAIAGYERATRLVPDPTYVGALGDLYRIAGRESDARAQYDLVEHIRTLSALAGTVYDRQLASFYADHDIEAEMAYAAAAKAYVVRRDIYGADTLAWTALKAGRVEEAQAAIGQALRLGTSDARLLYHAGMVARAAGDQARKRELLGRALALSPAFDPVHAPLAREAVEE